MNIFKLLILFFLLIGAGYSTVMAQESEQIDPADLASGAIFDDKALLDGYADKYADESQEILLAIVADDSVGAFKTASAVKVFKEHYAGEVLAKEKPGIIKLLAHRLNRSDSPFVQVEIIHTLVVLDRYQYFVSMVPSLIQKMEHYNAVVSTMAYDNVQSIIKDSSRPREARIVFNTMRKIFFLSRNKLQNIDVPDAKLRQRLDILRWSVKVLGTQELKRLPSEVIGLL